MNESHSELPFNTTTNYNSNSGVDIPIEHVSEEDMAAFEAALASASSSLSSSTASVLLSEEKMASIEASLASTRSSLSSSAVPAICSTSQSHSHSHSQYEFQRNARSIQSITVGAKRRLSFCTEPPDIEDLGSLRSNQKKKSRVADSFFHRFRIKTGLFVRDITETVWSSFFGGVWEMGLIYFC